MGDSRYYFNFKNTVNYILYIGPKYSAKLSSVQLNLLSPYKLKVINMTGQLRPHYHPIEGDVNVRMVQMPVGNY